MEAHRGRNPIQGTIRALPQVAAPWASEGGRVKPRAEVEPQRNGSYRVFLVTVGAEETVESELGVWWTTEAYDHARRVNEALAWNGKGA